MYDPAFNRGTAEPPSRCAADTVLSINDISKPEVIYSSMWIIFTP